MPEALPVTRRVDDSAGDMTSLVRLGLAEPQPVPDAPAPPPADEAPPPLPPPVSDPVDEAEAAAISAALTDAGITATVEDQEAVQELAKLDPATVAAVTRWMRTKKPRPDIPLDGSK